MSVYKASIDIGSNSVVLLIAKVFENQIIEVIHEEVNITSLGKNLDENHLFSRTSMESTFLVLSKYSKIIKQYKINLLDVLVSATEASRVAKNANIFFDDIKSKIGICVTIIEASEEARLTALGVVSGLKSDIQNIVSIFDIGGASTELIKVQVSPFKILKTISLPIGSARAKDLKDKDQLISFLDSLKNNYKINLFKSKVWICVAGTMTTLGLCYFNLTTKDLNKLNFETIDFEQFDFFVDQFSQINLDDLLIKYPFIGKRSEVIKEGANVCSYLLKSLECEQIKISTYGLRHGIVLNSCS